MLDESTCNAVPPQGREMMGRCSVSRFGNARNVGISLYIYIHHGKLWVATGQIMLNPDCVHQCTVLCQNSIISIIMHDPC